MQEYYTCACEPPNNVIGATDLEFQAVCLRCRQPYRFDFIEFVKRNPTAVDQMWEEQRLDYLAHHLIARGAEVRLPPASEAFLSYLEREILSDSE